MLKQLTIVALVGALLPACVLTTGDTATDTNQTSETTSTTGGTTVEATVGTTGGTTDGTTGGTTAGTTAELPTTGEPTTGEPTTAGTTGSTTDGTTGEPSAFGMCGWVADANYYGCVDEGADPGVEDPAAIDPIACPADLVAGDPCNEKEGPVKNVGCCMPNGDLFLCDSQGAEPTDTITKVECGA